MPLHPITKDLDHALKQFAARLPEPGFGSAPQPGTALLQQAPGMLTATGLPLQPDQLYFVIDKHTRRNHLNKLRRVYRRGGKPALIKYLVPYAEFLKTE
jgi:hypothetical protein